MAVRDERVLFRKGDYSSRHGGVTVNLHIPTDIRVCDVRLEGMVLYAAERKGRATDESETSAGRVLQDRREHPGRQAL